jgi:hypothetical protein
MAAYQDSSDEEDEEQGTAGEGKTYAVQQQLGQQQEESEQQVVGRLSVDGDAVLGAPSSSRRRSTDVGELHRTGSHRSSSSRIIRDAGMSREAGDAVSRRSSRDESELSSSSRGSQGKGMLLQQSPGSALSRQESLGRVQGLVMESVSEQGASLRASSWGDQDSRGAAWIGDDVCHGQPEEGKESLLGQTWGHQQQHQQGGGMGSGGVWARGSMEEGVAGASSDGAGGVDPCSSRQQQVKEWQQQQQQQGLEGVGGSRGSLAGVTAKGGLGAGEGVDGGSSTSSGSSYTFPWLKLWCMVMVWLCFLALSTINSMLSLCSWQYVGFMLLFLMLTVGVTAMFIRVVIMGPEEGGLGRGGWWGSGWQGFRWRVQRWVKYRWQGGGGEAQDDLLDVEAQEEEEKEQQRAALRRSMPRPTSFADIGEWRLWALFWPHFSAALRTSDKVWECIR